MDSFNATFYTLVSLDTEEVKFADARQQHLVDQGFFFEVIQQLPFMRNPKEKEKLIFSTKKEQADFLNDIIKQRESKDMLPEDMKKLEKDEDVLMLQQDMKKDMSVMYE